MLKVQDIFYYKLMVFILNLCINKKKNFSIRASDRDRFLRRFFLCVCVSVQLESNLPFTYICKIKLHNCLSASRFSVRINVWLLFYLPADHTVSSHSVMLAVTRRNSQSLHKWYSRPLDHQEEVQDWKEFDIVCEEKVEILNCTSQSGSGHKFKFRKWILKP